jgi:hypothetical protein
MDQQTNEQEPSSKESGEIKSGDKVWVLCEVKDKVDGTVRVEGAKGATWWMYAGHCRPVEPPVVKDSFTAETNIPEIPDSLSGPLAPSPCMDGVNVDEFVDGIMEARGRVSDPIKVGDAVRFVLPGHKHHGTEGTIASIGDSSERKYSFESNCGHIKGPCTIAELEIIDRLDPINPSHYKQGGIECIEAIKAALGDGFPDYLRGNVMKYLWRYKEKGGVDDLRKSAWYLDRLFREVGE